MNKFRENACRCYKFDNSKEKHERELEDKRKDYIPKTTAKYRSLQTKEILQN